MSICNSSFDCVHWQELEQSKGKILEGLNLLYPHLCCIVTGLRVMKVMVDPKTYNKSKIAPTIIAKIAEKMRLDPDLESPKAKRKWLEMVDLDGEQFAVSCHEESGVAVITFVRQSRRKTGEPWKR